MLTSHDMLILGFTDGGARPVERCTLPPEGALFGRDVLFFPGGPLDDAQLSRRHAEVRRKRDRWVVRDLGSRNGTWVNGERLQGERSLTRGDVLRLGSSLVIYAGQMADGDGAQAIAPKLIGDSDRIAAVRRAIGMVAGKPRAVLVTGETGTGKELVAEALHQRSGRPGRLVAVNCGAFSEDILASELFGHVRGAFTGAVKDQPGLFRAADRGTLFLDEIGEMPLPLQAKLLRVLEVGKVRPVGSTEDVPSDVAIVAATNRDLIEEVRQQRFRSDLYARLAQWLIPVPPLRERRDDLPALVRHLLARSNAAGKRMTARLSEALFTHPWPLNVRGLLNVLSIAVLAAPHGGPLDLCPEVAAALTATSAVASSGLSASKPKGVPSAEELQRALDLTNGRISAAARHVGCSRQQLYRWLEKRGIDPKEFRSGDDAR
ncbi:Response regulator of zinc sigma-54-dependent two-component system [Minicystis rosea]|nr:Response regulator of zinc sigma-54-dependent two-component system [Minicystis rosea]